MNPISFEDVARMPAPGMSAPVNMSYNPDGSLLAYLHSPNNELTRQLYGYNTATKQVALVATPPGSGNTESNLSLEEKLRRERQRQHGVGITSFIWNPHSTQILYPTQGNLYLQQAPGTSLQLLFDKSTTGAKGGAIDPQYSPDGTMIAFVQDGEIYTIPAQLASNNNTPQKATILTHGARDIGKTNGLACFVTQEELSRFRGFWWSPDSRHIAFEEIDDTHIPKFRIMHSGSGELGENAEEDHRYPFAGKANPKRRLGVLQVNTNDGKLNKATWMDLEQLLEEPDFYITRVNWLPDASLGVQTLNRLQTHAKFIRFTIDNGRGNVLIQEDSKVWINANYLYRALEYHHDTRSFTFIWGSERSGFMHLYCYAYDGKTSTAICIAPVTSGEGNVESIEGIDIEKKLIYFSGNLNHFLERQLFVVTLPSVDFQTTPCASAQSSTKTAPMVQITKSKGMHHIVMSQNCSSFIDVHSDVATPPKAIVYSFTASITGNNTVEIKILTQECVLHETVNNTLKLDVTAPEIIEFQTRDQNTLLYGAVYKPNAANFGPGPYPTMVAVYGGPHVQRVNNAWNVTVDMRAQLLCSKGFLVLKVDNRGSFRRGIHFEGFIKHQMGTVEVSDQQDGVNYLIERGLTIPDRVGIYGWSYGGYMSALSLFKIPETFKLAVAGAPVTSWDGYDTCYTERYMSTPELNPEGYLNGSVMECVSTFHHKAQAKYKNQKLLLIHGLIDENVHFRHTARLINTMTQYRQEYDLLLFPNERHSPRNVEDRIYMEQRIMEYVQKYL